MPEQHLRQLRLPGLRLRMQIAGRRATALPPALTPGTQHGFHNNSTPRYDKDAAKLAWKRTLALFDATLES